ncbi:extracellular solute-binding protein [Rhodoferax sp.]|jgi:putrescine transport system substrate-binding protein|uniref:extracellular solute-binding protein n=1 Tax=Rhodoferax sp. TaxID=50421 RepID=UPI0037844D7B
MFSTTPPIRWIANSAIAFFIGLCGAAQAQTTLKVLNWSEYIGPNTVAKFEKATGIKVVYSILDSDDTLQAKLLSGNSGFDVVYPSSNYMAKQIKAGLFEPIDWTKIPNRKHLDAAVMAQTAKNDPDNKFGVPYVWGTEGLIINMTKARQAWGGDLPPLSFDLLFKPENAKRLQKCGIALIDQPSEASTMLAYMGRDPNSPKLSDTEDAFKELAKIRPYIKLFSNNVIQDVSSGNICITTGWSGDYNVMKRRAKAAGKDFDIRYATPKGATGLWFTMMGIPKDSKNKDAAHKWINFLLSPEIAAENSNEITYTSAVGAARALVKPELANDPFLYPTEAEMSEYFAFKPQDTALLRATNKLWLRYKSGR